MYFYWSIYDIDWDKLHHMAEGLSTCGHSYQNNSFVFNKTQDELITISEYIQYSTFGTLLKKLYRNKRHQWGMESVPLFKAVLFPSLKSEADQLPLIFQQLHDTLWTTLICTSRHDLKMCVCLCVCFFYNPSVSW